MMQMALDEVVDVVTMRNCGMSATRSVHMVHGMTAARMPVGARPWIRCVDFNRVLFHDTGSCLVVQMAIMQVIDMVSMFDGRMPTLGAVNMVVIRVFV
jgi:hypothetical protein